MAIKSYSNKAAYDAAVKPTIESQVSLIETNREGVYEIIFTDDGLKLELVPEARKEEELELEEDYGLSM